jgi:tetratricopeptide (TPR) repeat protein
MENLMRHMAWIVMTLTLGFAGAPGCTQTKAPAAEAPEAVSLLGQPLRSTSFRASVSPDDAEQQARELQAAKTAFDASPQSEDAIIWYGRRLAYAGRFSEAIEVYTQGLSVLPDSAKMLRHRGHRYITTRQLDKAIADLTLASELTAGMDDEVEPDGQPNAQNIPTSTLQTNIWYHLGLAHYLRGDFDQAGKCMYRCLDLAGNDDMRVAAAYWLYLSWMRSGLEARAERVLANITTDLHMIENFAYQRILLLLKGETTIDEVLGGNETSVDDATTAYGIAMWHKLNGRADEALRGFEQVVRGSMWPAFGFIAAEAELAHALAAPEVVELVE